MPRLRVLTTCPGTDWVPGQVVDATVEQANDFIVARRAELIRYEPIELADQILSPTEIRRLEGLR